MSLSIHTNAVQMSALRSLSMAAEYTKAAEARLATGKNIVDAYTDGAAFAVSVRIDTNVKAINAVRMAKRGDGKHKVSLDKVIKTMRDTGRDMRDKYKETSRGGLAVNVIEC